MVSNESLNNNQIESILQNLKSISSRNALDVATGQGVFIRSLMKTLKDYHAFTGIDIYQKGLNQAVKKFKKNSVEFLNMSAEALDFTDEFFDLVSISESLHHLQDPAQVLVEIKRVIQSDGFLILQESFSDSDQSHSQISDVLIHKFIAKIDILNGVYHHEFYSRQEMVRMVEKSGFKNLQVFISQSPLKCVFCKYLDHCKDFMGKRMINTGLRAISTSLKSARNLPQYNDFKSEAKGLRKKIRENGYSPASVIFIFAKK